ncbi:hypothetical protein CU098_004292 [Rhizopus stolonifer]|uniref:Zn(2)-C6 fungal-type domain-containing protein n=1 Tax=Rhizopus stolonifer TaxID=4846 RepID=A0A367KT48_RHIST|nr:hypothetical protein CU098_004292 [Rhizopus stolonifer]
MNIVPPGKDNSMDSDREMPLKRTRAKRSCDFCRKRKSRCDADHAVPCSNCRAWGLNCEFVTVRKKRGPPSVYVEKLEARCKKMEALIAKLTNKSIKEVQRNDYPEIDISEPPKENTRDSIESTIIKLSPGDYDSIKYTGASAGICLDSALLRSKPFVNCPGHQDVALQLMPHNELLFVQANASSLSGSYTRLDVGFSLSSTIFDKETRAPVGLQSEPLLSLSTIQKACGLYFSHLHQFLPVVNKSRFDLPPLLSHAVLAVSFRFASRHFPSLFPKPEDVTRARLCHVQAALLITVYLDMDQEEDVDSLQWSILGRAIRMAQDIGLHRSCKDWNLPSEEKESRHRVFYVCYVLDRLLGARAGKPLTILDRDFDTPLELVDQSMVALVKLCEILGRILKAMYAPKCKPANIQAGLDDPTILTVLEGRLKHWKATLGTVPQAQKDYLLLLYYTTLSLLHRPFIESDCQTVLATASRKVCETAAYNVLVMIEKTKDMGPLPTFYVYAIFQSCLIHLALVLQTRDILRFKRLAYALFVLKKHSGAQRAYQIMIKIMAVYDIHMEHTNAHPPLVLLPDLDLSAEMAEDKALWCERRMNTSIMGGVQELNQIAFNQPYLYEKPRHYSSPLERYPTENQNFSQWHEWPYLDPNVTLEQQNLQLEKRFQQ